MPQHFLGSQREEFPLERPTAFCVVEARLPSLFADSTQEEEERDQRGVRLKSAENIKASARTLRRLRKLSRNSLRRLVASAVDWILGVLLGARRLPTDESRCHGDLSLQQTRNGTACLGILGCFVERRFVDAWNARGHIKVDFRDGPSRV